MQHLRFALLSLGLAAALFLAMLLFIEIGRRLGLRHAEKRGPGARAGVGVVDSAVYSLLGLLIGFTFSGAAGRFDKRRELVVQQVNAISTAWLRVDLLPAEPQPALRDAFRRYLDALLGAYEKPAGSAEELSQRHALKKAESEIWTRTVTASLDPRGEKARVLLIPTVNEMFDAVDTERLAQRLHPPFVIWVMLVITALAASLFAGYALASAPLRNWIYIVGVAATISIAGFVILELESPRLGWIRVDAMHDALTELRATMK